MSNGPIGNNDREPPPADAQCSVCHPLRRAMAASFASGLTATGNPTHSRSGRSDAESAYAIDSPRSSPSAAAYSARTRARASPVGGSCSRRPVRSPSSSLASRAQTTSSNRGLIGSTTKSRAPVMRTVRCPSALWRLTRAMPAGKDRVQQQIVEQLRRVRCEQLLGRTLVTAVEAPQEVPAVAAVEREESRGLAKDPCGHPGPVGKRQVAGGEPRVGLDDVRCHESVLEVERGEVALRREDGP